MIYLAAPFFNPAQLAQVQQVEDILASLDLAFYSPRLEGSLQGMTAQERAAQAPVIFQRNIAQMQAATVMVALLDDKDTGTTWELGYAYANGMGILGVTTQPQPMNVMLRQCMHCHAPDLDAMGAALLTWHTTGCWPVQAPQLDVY